MIDLEDNHEPPLKKRKVDPMVIYEVLQSLLDSQRRRVSRESSK